MDPSRCVWIPQVSLSAVDPQEIDRSGKYSVSVTIKDTALFNVNVKRIYIGGSLPLRADSLSISLLLTRLCTMPRMARFHAKV